MKAYALEKFGLEGLKIVEAASPEPGVGQVLVNMQAWSLNYRDLLVVKGLYNPKLKLPFTPFSDGAGEVVAVGAGVSRVKKGDRVAGTFMQAWSDGPLTDAGFKSALGGALPGVLAEQVVLQEEGVVRIPEHLSFEEAATLPCAGLTAWHALVDSGNLKAGDTVLVQGTGGVSMFALQIAKMHGARIIATSSSDAKLEKARALGASDGINYKSTPDWGKRVRELTGGVGVDHVVEVGGAGTLGESLRGVRMAGHIALIGVLAGGGEFNPMPILMKNARVQGIFVGSRAMFENMNRAIALHKMKPVVDRVFAFEEAAAALKHMESAAHFGKIVVRR